MRVPTPLPRRPVLVVAAVMVLAVNMQLRHRIKPAYRCICCWVQRSLPCVDKDWDNGQTMVVFGQYTVVIAV